MNWTLTEALVSTGSCCIVSVTKSMTRAVALWGILLNTCVIVWLNSDLFTLTFLTV